MNSLEFLLCNSGKGIFPSIFCLHLIGQNSVTCPPLAAREAEKWSIFIFWILYRGRPEGRGLEGVFERLRRQFSARSQLSFHVISP